MRVAVATDYFVRTIAHTFVRFESYLVGHLSLRGALVCCIVSCITGTTLRFRLAGIELHPDVT